MRVLTSEDIIFGRYYKQEFQMMPRALAESSEVSSHVGDFHFQYNFDQEIV